MFVSLQFLESIGRYERLDTTRAYAREKLLESGELEALARRHAEYYVAFFQRAGNESADQYPAHWVTTYGCLIDNVRALDWAFAPGGDAAIGVALTKSTTWETVWARTSMRPCSFPRVSNRSTSSQGAVSK
jgi:predicted ATPase